MVWRPKTTNRVVWDAVFLWYFFAVVYSLFPFPHSDITRSFSYHSQKKRNRQRLRTQVSQDRVAQLTQAWSHRQTHTTLLSLSIRLRSNRPFATVCLCVIHSGVLLLKLCYVFSSMLLLLVSCVSGSLL